MKNYAHFWCRPKDSAALMHLYWQTGIDFCTFHQKRLSVALSLSRSWCKQKPPETERKREYASVLIKRARQTFCPLLWGECKLCRGYHFLYHRLKFIYLDGKNNRFSVRGAHKFQSHFIIHFLSTLGKMNEVTFNLNLFVLVSCLMSYLYLKLHLSNTYWTSKWAPWSNPALTVNNFISSLVLNTKFKKK